MAYTGKRFVSGIASELVDAFYREGGRVSAEQLDCVDRPRPNENFVLRNGSKSVLATILATDQMFARVEKVTAYGVVPRNAEQSFALRGRCSMTRSSWSRWSARRVAGRRC